VAISGTGHGEVFIARAVCVRIAHLVELCGLTLEDAAHQVIHQQIADQGAGGGVIAVDAQGNLATPFNTAGMFRGHVRRDEEPWVGIWPCP